MAPKSASSFKLIAAVTAASAFTSGCTPELTKLFNDKIGPVIGMKLQPSVPVKDVSTAPQEESPSPDHRQMNAEFIREMLRVVLNRDIRNREEFDKFMNMLDQGGHYEGLYNGVVYAGEYRDKEKGVAPIAALKAFSEIMAQIQLDQKYDPLKIAKAEADSDSQPQEQEQVKAPQPSEPERIQLVGDLERDAMTKSTYWMKRRLGEEVMRTIDLKKEYREKLATWYGRFTVTLNKRGVDFGLPIRNKADEYFHYKWALDADEDRLKWECLNRLHRVIDTAAGLPIPQVQPVQLAPQGAASATSSAPAAAAAAAAPSSAAPAAASAPAQAK